MGRLQPTGQFIYRYHRNASPPLRWTILVGGLREVCSRLSIGGLSSHLTILTWRSDLLYKPLLY
jgi:hypothetical protein